MCGDFTTNANTRGGKCLYCFDNPGQMVGGKPKALAKYLDAEEKKDAEASRLQLACAETPLSLELITLQTAYDAAKVGPPTFAPVCLPACLRTCLPTYLPAYPPTCLPIYPPTNPLTRRSPTHPSHPTPSHSIPGEQRLPRPPRRGTHQAQAPRAQGQGGR